MVFVLKASLSESYVVDVCCRDKNRADYIHIHISIKVHLKVVRSTLFHSCKST
jgi:hypothetical protein